MTLILPSSNYGYMADIAYGSIGRDILFHILRYATKEIHRFSNRSICNVEGTHHLIWQTSHHIWQQRILTKVAAQCYVNGVIEILCKYLQSQLGKLWSNIPFLGRYLYLEEIFHKWVHIFKNGQAKRR